MVYSKTIELPEEEMLMIFKKKSSKESERATERGRTTDKENRNWQNF